jgi:tRNA 2-thiouridine synthesizing protein A
MSEYDDELDCSGLNCPMPILKTKMKIDKMNSGQVLKVIATDPGVVVSLIRYLIDIREMLIS